MKRQLILGLILVLLVGISFGAYFFVDRYQTQKEQKALEEAKALQLSSLDEDSVTTLTIHTTDADYVLTRDGTNSWMLDEDGETMNINNSYVTSVCSYGCNLTASKDLGVIDDTEKETYGLADPITLTFQTDSSSLTLYVGKATSTNEYYYVMREGDDHAYLIEATTGLYLSVNETQLRYRYVIEDSTSDFNLLTLQRDGSIIYNIEKTDGDWEMTIPYNIPISLDNSKLSTLFINLQNLEIEDFGEKDVQESEYAEYGLDDPAYQLQLQQDDGTVTTLLFEEYDPLVSSYVNCLHVETDEILVFDSANLSFLQSDADEYLLDTVYSPTIDTVQSLSIDYTGSYNDTTLDIHTEFTIDSANGTYACDGTDFSDMSSEVKEAFQNLYSKATGLTYESIDTTDTGPSADAEPALQLQYTLTDGTVHTVTLYAKDDTTYWACLDDAFTYTTVRQRTLSGNGKLLERYTEFMELFQEASS